ncbi:phage portal protein, partial [Salmonella enterica subsp. enterica serovar Infantis]
LSYYAVFSCISLIASDIAKMPPRLMKQDSNGVRRDIKTGKIAALYSRPNAFQNRIQCFVHWLNAKLCEGNAVALSIRTNR